MLLERTSRKVTLTEAGAVLLSEARAILGTVAAAERRTRQAAQSRPRPVLAAKPGTADEVLAELLDAYRAVPEAASVDLLLPTSACTDLRRDLAAVPVLDAPPVTTVIAWPSQSRLREVADLVRVATSPRPGPRRRTPGRHQERPGRPTGLTAG
ncbi:hypothetical protein [Streptomyces sp. NPDC006879]|uniref:hypothetical protein n=1 Tax=Streptomyces sp. NPDC006879 TaxID=3364767 RepID=UPI003676F83B